VTSNSFGSLEDSVSLAVQTPEQVRHQTLHREGEISSRFPVSNRKRDMGDEVSRKTTARSAQIPWQNTIRRHPSDGSEKIPQSVRRGVPIVEGRQVSGSTCYLRLF
jgi:hypothetical protein